MDNRFHQRVPHRDHLRHHVWQSRQYLVQDGVPVVYLFDNCVEDAGNTIETLGADLGAFLNTIKYDSGAQVPQIDLVAHSMGGLIARAYLAGIQPDETFQPPTPTLVRKLVLIATPNFGSFVAGNNWLSSIGAGTQSAELVPGSAFLWNWPRGTSAATICAGQRHRGRRQRRYVLAQLVVQYVFQYRQ